MASVPEAPSASTSMPPPPIPNPTKPLRFKRKRTYSPSPPPLETHDHPLKSNPSYNSHRSHRHHHHHRSKRRPRPSTPPPELNPWDPAYGTPNDPSWRSSMHPDAAFRESLFDALADDEGAAFWEGVYGQPIHTYSPYYAPNSLNGEDEEDDPEHPRLERMSDEEYTAYVRAKMWEKSHGYVIEERRRREEERKEKRKRDEEGRKWQLGVEEALKRGEVRRKKNKWKGVWEQYLRGWEGMKLCSHGEGKGTMKEQIAWPVESGAWKDVGREEVERFFRHGPQAVGEGEVSLGDVLKKERVRWHPDKMQQRAGSGGIDGGTMKLITAVFQVVDRLWSETRKKP